MATIADALTLAWQYEQAGRRREAAALYRDILQQQPDQCNALHRLGVLAYYDGKHAEAVEFIRKAIAVEPQGAGLHSDIGEAYRALGKPEDAAVHLRQALALDPTYADAHVNLGNLLQDQGKFDEAVGCYRKALTLKPAVAETYNNLGNVLKAQGKLDEAVESYRQALARNPAYAQAYSNLGLALQEQGRLEEATNCLRRAVALKPDFAEGHNNLGNVLKDQGLLDGATSCYRQALALNPSFAGAYYNLGNVFFDQSMLGDAEQCYRRALALKPDFAEACNNLGEVLKRQGKLEDAFIQFRQALAFKPGYAEAHSNLLMYLAYSNEISAEALAAEHKAWNDRHARPLASGITPHTNDRTPDRRLRVGYVSGDFCKHSVGYFLESLLVAHNRAKVTVYCYSNVWVADGTTERLKAMADVWREIRNQPDDAVADRIRADKIDILVDLSGHTAHNRLLVFARKPVPVQVTYLGYGATTGLSVMDYLLTDQHLTPTDSHEWFSEEVVRLPGCYVCYSPPSDAPPVGPLPASTTGYVTLGSFNNLAKMTPAVVGLWAEILRALPAAKLLLKDRALADAAQQSRYLSLFAKEGIGTERLQLVPRIGSSSDHLACYGLVDVALDPFPYNGCTTTCEALWMGVPVISLAGRMSHGRYGCSLLAAVGLEEFVATTPSAYVEKAVALAKDRKRLASLRAELRPRMAASPLCDAKTFAPKVEEAYRLMWRRWCQSA